VNQVTHDLRRDFRELTPLVRVEQAVPAFELDPTEDRLLISDLDVIVSTPEKLDLLVRRRHPAVEDIALVVADEAHNICDETRGPRLELLLGAIKRDHPGARFLLLSPFLPNDEELVLWLGEDRALPPISVDWKPSRKLVGTVDIIRLSSTPTLVFETLPAADNTDVRAGMQLPIGRGIASQTNRTISGLTRATVDSMLEHGSTYL
jgi:DEAD/DEAH box helicase